MAAISESALLFKARHRVLSHLDRAARWWLASALEQAHPGHARHKRLQGRRRAGG
jgi:hypothetical protein